MSTTARRLRLGTRGSRLAMAQSRQVAAAIERHQAGLQVELARISTRGDRDLSTPLAQVADEGFFSADIDAALLRGDVDFTVHSRKDLDGPRPAGLVTAAMPARANPRDVVLFRPNVLERLRCGAPLRLGTSSQRRARYVRAFLERALPRVGPPPCLECRPLRGPVDQRLDRLAPHQAEPLDAIVLALAGLERLWEDPGGRTAIEAKLADLRWMVLPLTECPTAPGQGALAVECRADDTATRELLSALHDQDTASAVEAEYAAAAELADQDRAAFAGTAVHTPGLGRLMFARSGNEAVAGVRWPAPPRPAESSAWDGGAWHRACQYRALQRPLPTGDSPAVFVAHWRAFEPTRMTDARRRVWVSGWQSWQRLSAAGQWVEGCADGLGFAALRSTLATGVLQLPPLAKWLVLTRAGAEQTWQDAGVGTVIGSYALDAPDASTIERLRREARRATDFYWSSREQFLALRDCLPPDARHACGTGKTWHALAELGVHAQPFPSRKAWQAWLS